MTEDALAAMSSIDQLRQIVIGALVVGLIVWAAWYLLPCVVASVRLRAATQQLKQRRTTGSARYASPWKEWGTTHLSMAWDRFVRAWRNGTVSESEDGPSSILPETFFTFEVAFGSRSRRIPEALPGVFAGIGLLGTFIGISQGLSTIDLSSNDPGLLMRGVNGLMEGMAVAFDTSIYGIGFSLIWVLLFRLARHDLTRALHGFNLAVEDAFPYEDPQTTLLRIARASDRTNNSIKSLGGDIAEALEQAVNKAVAPSLDGMTKSLDLLTEQLQSHQFDGMEKIVESFRETFRASLEKDIKRFSEALTSAANQQEKTADRMENFFEQVERVSESQMKLLERTSEVSAAFSEGLETLEVAQTAISEATDSVLRLLEEASRTSDESRGQSETLRQANIALQESLAAQIDTTQQHVQGVFEFWDSFEEKLKAMSHDLTQSLGELTTFTAQKLGEVFKAFDSEMATVVEHLSGTLSELRSVTEDLPGVTQKLSASMAQLPPALDGASAQFAKLVEQVGQTRSQASDELKKLGVEIGKLSTTSSDSLVTLNDALPRVATTSGDLAKVFEETNAQLENLRKEMELLRNSRGSRLFPFGRG